MRGEYGRGSITHDAASDRYQVKVPIPGQKPIRRWAKTREQAEAIRESLIRQREAGKIVGTPDQTLREYLEAWLRDTARHGLRDHTYDCYMSRLERIAERIGGLRLSEVTPAHIRTCYSDLRDTGRSAATIAGYHMVLRTALSQAVEDGILERNPTDTVKRPKIERREMSVLSDAEINRVLEAAIDDRWSPLWTLLLTTGLRVGEALGLVWEHVDRSKRELHVRQTVTFAHGKGLFLGPVKTQAAWRTVQFPEITLRALSALRAEQAERYLARGWFPDRDLVFPATNEGPIWPYVVWKAWRRVLDRAEVKHVRVHDQRHTAATSWLLHGVDLKTVQEMLGHSDPMTTARLYAHSSPAAHRAAADLWDQIITPKEKRA